MNKVFLIWNLLLTVGVVFLLFRDPPPPKMSPLATDTTRVSAYELPIVYINIDSLEKHYKLFADKRNELEKKQKSMEALLERKFTDMQNDYQAVQQAAPTMTQAQLEEAQRRLENKQLEIQRLQQQLETDFQRQIDAFNRQLEDSLSSFLAYLNADKQFRYVLSYTRGGTILYSDPELEITDQVIAGMNNRLGK
ncbi:MAG: OmpH family outer membrane protein [Chitinophagales bacterium]|nr:OmpH family outer membrane protein [Chitinophagales bacterium]